MRVELNKAVGVFVLVVGVVGSIVSILVAPSNMQIASFALLFTTLLVVGSWLILRPMLEKRRADRAIEGVKYLPTEATAYIIDPATPEDIEWIAQLEAEVYSRTDAIPVQILREWYKANPSGFFVIRMKDNSSSGRRIGHLDILPLRPQTLRQFLDGEIVERDIRGDCLYPIAEKDSITDLYVESIIIRPLKGYSGATAITCLLSNFLPIAKNMCNIHNIKHVYAISASDSGTRLMQHLGFEVQKPADSRKDRHNLFIGRFATIAENVARICDERFKDRALLEQILKQNISQGL